MDGAEGVRLADLAARTGLDRSTAHRLLGSLARYGFVDQDRATKRYHPGLEFFTVAAAASNRNEMSAAVRTALLELSHGTSAAAMFLLRSADELVCVDLQFGELETSAAPIDLGSRWPIGAGAPGVAVLAALRDDEAEDIAVGNARRYAMEPESAIRAIRIRMIETRRLGYAIDLDPIGGMATVAMAVAGRSGAPEGAIAVNGPAHLLDADPRGAIVTALRRQALSLQLAIGGWGRRVAHREIRPMR